MRRGVKTSSPVATQKSLDQHRGRSLAVGAADRHDRSGRGSQGETIVNLSNALETEIDFRRAQSLLPGEPIGHCPTHIRRWGYSTGTG